MEKIYDFIKFSIVVLYMTRMQVTFPSTKRTHKYIVIFECSKPTEP